MTLDTTSGRWLRGALTGWMLAVLTVGALLVPRCATGQQVGLARRAFDPSAVIAGDESPSATMGRAHALLVARPTQAPQRERSRAARIGLQFLASSAGAAGTGLLAFYVFEGNPTKPNGVRTIALTLLRSKDAVRDFCQPIGHERLFTPFGVRAIVLTPTDPTEPAVLTPTGRVMATMVETDRLGFSIDVRLSDVV